MGLVKVSLYQKNEVKLIDRVLMVGVVRKVQKELFKGFVGIIMENFPALIY